MSTKDGIPGPITHRFIAVKQHKLRGEYLRTFEIGMTGFVNVDPNTAQVTNRWRFDQLEEIILPDPNDPSEVNSGVGSKLITWKPTGTQSNNQQGKSRGNSQQHTPDRDEAGSSEEHMPSTAGRFQLLLSNGGGGALSFGSGKSTMTFWSPCRGELLSTLNAKKHAGRQTVFRVDKVSRRRPGRTRDCLLVAGESGLVEVADENATRILHAYRYVDIECVQQLNQDSIVFVSGIDKRPRAFRLGPHIRVITNAMQASCRASNIPVIFSSQNLATEEWEAMGRAYARAAVASQTVCEFAVKKRGGSDDQQPIRLRVTTRHLVELERDSDLILSVRSLTRVFVLVRPIEFDGDFDILLHSEEQDLEYTIDEEDAESRSGKRDSFLAQLLDACSRRKSRVPLLPIRPRGACRVVPRHVVPPHEMEMLYFRRILTLAASQQIKELGSQLHNVHLQRLLQACADFTGNSSWPLHSMTLAQFKSSNDLHGAGAVAFIFLTGLLIRADPEKVHPRASLQALEVILRMVDRRDMGGLYNISAMQTFEIISVLTVSIQANNDMIVIKGLEILSALLGRGVRDKSRDQAAETANKIALLTPNLIDSLASVWRKYSSNALVSARAASIFEQCIVSGRDSTPEDIYQRMLETLLRMPSEIVASLHYRVLETLESIALLLRVAIEESGLSTELEAIQEEALRTGVFLQEMREAIFGSLDARGFASQCLVHNFTISNRKGEALMHRILPSGLFSTGQIQVNAANHMDEEAAAPALRRTALEKRLDLAIHTLRSGHRPGQPLTKEIANGVAHMRRNDMLDGVFHVIEQTHETPNLIWNAETRSELLASLDQELKFLLAPGSLSSYSWNYEEFAVEYKSLRDEVMAGPAYMRLILSSDEAARQVREPKEVFGALYNQYLKDEHPEDSLRAMELVYRCHGPAIGDFADVCFLVDRVAQCRDTKIQLLLLAAVRACVASKVNLIRLVLHHSTVSSLVATLPLGREDTEKTDASAFTVSSAALDLLRELASLQSTTDAQGRQLRPPPRAIRLICEMSTWQQICRAMEVPSVAPAVADLLCTTISYGADKQALAGIHQTGVLESALLVENKDALVKVACLLDALLPYQRANLLNFIPESLVCVLERDGAERFAEVYAGNDVSGADVIWTSEMREQVRAHLAEYRGGPTPPVVFTDLEDEYFCNGYYINRLAPMSPGELDIDNPVSLLEGIIEIWRTESERRDTNGGPQHDARVLLGLSESQGEDNVDLETLNSAFREQASKSDLDAKGLTRLQAAYRTLASRSPGRGVSSKLLLQTQALLYQQYKSELHGHPYSALDLLMDALQSSEIELVQAAMLLAHALSAASPKHAVDLADRGAVETILSAENPETGLPLAEGLRTLVLWASLGKSKARVREPGNLEKLWPQLLKVLHTAEHKESLDATVQSTLQVIARLADDENLQNDMYKRGFIWAVLPLLFRPDSPVSAKHAARALARLGGLLSTRELSSPRNENVTRALGAALTPPVMRLLREPNPSKLLATVNADSISSPTVVWDASMRSQIVDFLSTSPEADILPDLQVSERCIGGLYVRLFVECKDKASAVEELEAPASTVMELLRAHEETPLAENLVAVAGITSFVGPDALAAITNALILAQPPVIPSIVANLNVPELKESAVDSLETFCERQPSLSDAVQSSLRESMAMPECSREASLLDLRLLSSLPFLGGAEDVRELLNIALNDMEVEVEDKSNSVLPEDAVAGSNASSAKLVSDRNSRRDLAIKLLRKCPDALLLVFIPVGIVRALRKGTLTETIQRAHVAEPELMWSSNALARLKDAVVQSQDSPIERVSYPEIDAELCVGGVFVRAFLGQVEKKNTEFLLEDEPGFLRDLLTAFTQATDSSNGQGSRKAPPPVPRRQASAVLAKGAPPPVPSRRNKPSSTHAVDEEGEGSSSDFAENGGYSANELSIKQDLKPTRAPPPPPSEQASDRSKHEDSNPSLRSESSEQKSRGLMARAIVIMVERCPDEAAALSTAGLGPRLVLGLTRVKHRDEHLKVLRALAAFDSWAEHLASNTDLDIKLVELFASGANDAEQQVALDILDAMAPHLLRADPVTKLLTLIEPDTGALQEHADGVIDILHKVVHPNVRETMEHDEVWQHYTVAEQV